MLRPQLPNQAARGDYVGLGWFCTGEGDGFRWDMSAPTVESHAEARFYPATGQGAVIMINSNEGWCLPEELFKWLENPNIAGRRHHRRSAKLPLQPT